MAVGVKGIVSDALTGAPVVKAKVKIEGRLHGLNTTVLGEYWRLLLPGTYRLEVDLIGLYCNCNPNPNSNPNANQPNQTWTSAIALII